MIEDARGKGRRRQAYASSASQAPADSDDSGPCKRASAESAKQGRTVLELMVDDKVAALGVMEASGARNFVITIFDSQGTALSVERNGLLRKVHLGLWSSSTQILIVSINMTFSKGRLSLRNSIPFVFP